MFIHVQTNNDYVIFLTQDLLYVLIRHMYKVQLINFITWHFRERIYAWTLHFICLPHTHSSPRNIYSLSLILLERVPATIVVLSLPASPGIMCVMLLSLCCIILTNINVNTHTLRCLFCSMVMVVSFRERPQLEFVQLCQSMPPPPPPPIGSCTFMPIFTPIMLYSSAPNLSHYAILICS